VHGHVHFARLAAGDSPGAPEPDLGHRSVCGHGGAQLSAGRAAAARRRPRAGARAQRAAGSGGRAKSTTGSNRRGVRGMATNGATGVAAPVVVAQDLMKHYGPVAALDGFSLTVPAGMIYGL